VDPTSVFSALGAGIVIGLIARLLVPSMQPIGCIVTIVIGILGAFLGLGIATWANYADSFWLVFITQIFVAIVLVAITASLFRKSGP
jgi:uncharacterized membrane protein YeaQ/YmgE (transglycosylase-associated protein family)